MFVTDDMIGGGYVRRLFNAGGRTLKAGTHLTRDEILAFSPNNRQALIDGRQLEIYPPSPVLQELHAVHTGFGNYDVIEGTKINDRPLTQDEAQALIAEREATRPPTAAEEPGKPN